MGRFYTLENDSIKVVICDVGASLVSVFVKDRDNITRDVILGFDLPEEYENNFNHYGSIVGRYAGRIGNATFELNGKKYELERNDGDNCLHGGEKGFGTEVFHVCEVRDDSITLELKTPDMYQGFPGNVLCRVTYKITKECSIEIKISADTDADTFVNIINHAYFNLSGNPDCEVYGHSLKVNSSYVLETWEDCVVNGKIKDVTDTPFDFRKPKTLGREIELLSAGYNHNYVIDKRAGKRVPAARMECDLTGIFMELYTDRPCLQVYSSYYSDGSEIGKNKIPLVKASGVCLEAQGFTDVNHHALFPDDILYSGETYESNIVYKFGTYQVGQLNE